MNFPPYRLQPEHNHYAIVATVATCDAEAEARELVDALNAQANDGCETGIRALGEVLAVTCGEVEVRRGG